MSTCDDGFLLSSPMYHDPDPTPWPCVASTAVCCEDHPAPTPGCRCGIYAVIPGALDSLPGYLLDTAHKRDPWAYAEVACSGRVFVDKRGIRAEHAEILRIALAESGWPDEATLVDAKRRLHDRYRVPISGLEDVPGWVTTTWIQLASWVTASQSPSTRSTESPTTFLRFPGHATSLD